jgi:hypothetical protein
MTACFDSPVKAAPQISTDFDHEDDPAAGQAWPDDGRAAAAARNEQSVSISVFPLRYLPVALSNGRYTRAA